ncbi:MAG: acylneuraminate cytidylyltransferase family protein [Cyclobacteriaceae bacterium]
MSLLITICARGGSKGIPGKNIKELNGRPLLMYSIDLAKAFAKTTKSKITLSTDSSEIMTIASKGGLNTDYKRPDHLASDTAGKIDVLKHVLEYFENVEQVRYDYILDLDVTSPLRSTKDLQKAFDLLKGDSFAQNLVTVSPASRNPYFNMLEVVNEKYAQVVKRPDTPILSRQKAPKVYQMNSAFYFYKRSYFDSDQISTVDNGRTMIFNIEHLCFDLDEPIDFEFMSYLMERNMLDFKLC